MLSWIGHSDYCRNTKKHYIHEHPIYSRGSTVYCQFAKRPVVKRCSMWSKCSFDKLERASCTVTVLDCKASDNKGDVHWTLFNTVQVSFWQSCCTGLQRRKITNIQVHIVRISNLLNFSKPKENFLNFKYKNWNTLKCIEVAFFLQFCFPREHWCCRLMNNFGILSLSSRPSATSFQKTENSHQKMANRYQKTENGYQKIGKTYQQSNSNHKTATTTNK